MPHLGIMFDCCLSLLCFEDIQWSSEILSFHGRCVYVCFAHLHVFTCLLVVTFCTIDDSFYASVHSIDGALGIPFVHACMSASIHVWAEVFYDPLVIDFGLIFLDL